MCWASITTYEVHLNRQAGSENVQTCSFNIFFSVLKWSSVDGYR